MNCLIATGLIEILSSLSKLGNIMSFKPSMSVCVHKYYLSRLGASLTSLSSNIYDAVDATKHEDPQSSRSKFWLNFFSHGLLRIRSHLEVVLLQACLSWASTNVYCQPCIAVQFGTACDNYITTVYVWKQLKFYRGNSWLFGQAGWVNSIIFKVLIRKG